MCAQALCDGVCLISSPPTDPGGVSTAAKREDSAPKAEPAKSDPATLSVMSGPWYLDHISVWVSSVCEGVGE